jgi:hypothetical protein
MGNGILPDQYSKQYKTGIELEVLDQLPISENSKIQVNP